ncbi:MAG: ParB/RepB/Spo0J family partition protein [bacterium]|nr:ParB/RepB/Spo0J family partition protein [bacterium]
MKTKNTGLGKGLGALISSLEEDSKEGEYQVIPISKIEANPNQPRKDFDESSLAELAASIKQNGILQPILVIEINPQMYQIVAGERRWRAAQMAGFSQVPCRILKDISEKQIGTISLIENLQREDLNPIEFAVGCKRLLEENQWTHEELADRIGKARVTITNTLRLLNLPLEIQESIRQGVISEGHGRALLQCSEKEDIQLLWRKTIEKKLSVRQLEDLVQNKFKSKKSKLNSKQKFDDPVTRNLLENALGCKISLEGTIKKGKISLHYFSENEREILIQKLTNL